MKKLVLTIAIVLMMGTTVFAQNGGGALKRSKEYQENLNANRMNYRGGMRNTATPYLPGFNSDEDYDGTQSPLGSGVAVLVGLGAAYLVGKRRKED